MRAWIQEKFRINWWQTLRLNFHFFPWRVAIRLPIVVEGRLRVTDWSGSIQLPPQASFGTVVIGSRHETYVASCGKAQLSLGGCWKVNGCIRIGADSCIYIHKNALLETGDGCFLARDTQIHCFNRIVLADKVKAGEIYITDTSAHPIRRGGKLLPMTGTVRVGEGCYFGFRVMLLRGCVIPPYSVVGSGAICTRDYTEYGKCNLFLAGCPAEVKDKETRAE